jgi:xylulokinase
MSLLLGIDIGTSSAKAVVTTVDGRVAGQGASSYRTARPNPGWAEQDPEDWSRAAAAAVRMACAAPGTSERIAAIGLSGQMHGTVLLDRVGRALAPAIIWPDSRSARQVEEIEDTIGCERLVRLAGSRPATGFQAATVLWMQANRPDLWEATRQVLLPKDYVRYGMVGEFATDPSDASGTLFLNVRSRAWAEEILAQLRVETARLPPLRESSSIVGHLSGDAAEAMGLPDATAVVAGAADTAASALGASVTSADDLLVTLGTGGQVLLPVGEASVDPKGRIHTFCAALAPAVGLPGWYHMGAILSAGAALAWLKDEVFGLSGQDAYEQMTTWAGDAPAGASGLLFLPYLRGERTPHMDPCAAGVLLGITADHGRSALVRAVMEGVSLACYDAYRVLASLGATPRRLIIAGGGGRSPLWRQIIADTFGLPVFQLAGADQSAVGAALLAGAGVELVDLSEAARSWAHYSDPTLPDDSRHGIYQRLYALFREAYKKHREDFRELRASARRQPQARLASDPERDTAPTCAQGEGR